MQSSFSERRPVDIGLLYPLQNWILSVLGRRGSISHLSRQTFLKD